MGQASYHYDIDPYWDMFDCEEREVAPEWDGHTPDDAIERIGKLATLGDEKLTAEQIIAIAGKHQPDYCSDTHVCFDWQAIADELNASLNGETTAVTNELKPCPFCGNDSNFVKLKTYCDEKTFYKVACNDFKCLGANINKWFSSKRDAAKAGNLRGLKPKIK